MNNPFSELNRQNPEDVYNMIEPLNNQAVSIILYFLQTDSSKTILKSFELKRQMKILKKIDELSPLDEEAMLALGNIVKEKWKASKSGRIALNGQETLKNIMKYSPPQLKLLISDHVVGLKGKLPTQNDVNFNELAKMPDKHFQRLLKEVDRNTLIIAIKADANQFRAKLRNNMTQNAITMLESDLHDFGPVKKSDVIKAQKRVEELASQMKKNGAIVLADSDEWIE